MREAAVSLLGRHVAANQALALRLFGTLARASTDSGTSVRKAAIRILWESCIRAPGFPRATGERVCMCVHVCVCQMHCVGTVDNGVSQWGGAHCFERLLSLASPPRLPNFPLLLDVVLTRPACPTPRPRPPPQTPASTY